MDVSSRMVVLIALLAAVAGAIDAFSSNDDDLAVVFSTIAVLMVVVSIRVGWIRREVAIRKDLFDWLQERAAATCESPDALATRAIAAHRDALNSPFVR